MSVSVPPRDYHLAARLLADAAAADADGHTRRALAAAAERLGRELATEVAADAPIEPLLRERGYEPYEDEPGVIRLRNCPFHAVAQRHPEIVCEMNLALLRGLVEATRRRGSARRSNPARPAAASRSGGPSAAHKGGGVLIGA